MSKIRVFVDTNIILEAFRTSCWTAICKKYSVETVEKCIEEALTGNRDIPHHIAIDRNVLVNGLAARHTVSKSDIAHLILAHSECQGLDNGELHLFSWLKAYANLKDSLILISTADKAAIVATGKLGWIDSVVCLEHLVLQSGIRQSQCDNLARHFRIKWLDEIKLKIKLGIF